MGGAGSTRWDQTITRRPTDGLLRLDIRALARQGALEPGTSRMVRWDESASILVNPLTETVLALRYAVINGSGKRVPVDEHMYIDTTPCTFGGERAWVRCPGCGTRRAVLYALHGLFRCRLCHRLAYASTRRAVKQPSSAMVDTRPCGHRAGD
jgi:hypothetical protein